MIGVAREKFTLFMAVALDRNALTAQHVNRGASYGLEIPCEYSFTRDEFSIQWLKSKLEEQGFL